MNNSINKSLQEDLDKVFNLIHRKLTLKLTGSDEFERNSGTKIKITLKDIERIDMEVDSFCEILDKNVEENPKAFLGTYNKLSGIRLIKSTRKAEGEYVRQSKTLDIILNREDFMRLYETLHIKNDKTQVGESLKSPTEQETKVRGKKTLLRIRIAKKSFKTDYKDRYLLEFNGRDPIHMIESKMSRCLYLLTNRKKVDYEKGTFDGISNYKHTSIGKERIVAWGKPLLRSIKESSGERKMCLVEGIEMERVDWKTLDT